jgi:dimethylhistidine N-methyltransferase
MMIVQIMSDSSHSSVERPDPGGTVLQEILRGLGGEKKALPSKFLYDAAGSELFQKITQLPAYYLTRTEKKLLAEHGADIVAAIPAEGGCGRSLVEFGASDEKKALSLLDVVDGHFSAYVAIDISPSVLGPLRTRMQESHPHIKVETVVADFLQPLTMRNSLGATQAVGFLPGSTIGQYEPGTIIRFLENVRRAFAASSRAAFVIGTDVCNDPGRVLPAYDDPTGISKAFNLNMLPHINRLTGGNLDPASFGHEVRWNPREARIEIYLVSRIDQTAQIGGHPIRFAAGETIQTGTSYKYGKERFLSIAAEAGWSSGGFWQDDEKLFGIHLLQTG